MPARRVCVILAGWEDGGCLFTGVERFANKKEMLTSIVRRAVNIIHSLEEGLDKPAAVLRIRRPVERSDKHRNPFGLHGLQGRDHTQEDLADLPQRRLFVVERVQQAEDHGCAGMDGTQKCRQEMDHRLFQLVAGEAAGEEEVAQQTIGIAAGQAGGMDQRMGIEPVTTVHHRHAHAAQQRGRGDTMGEREHILAAVQGVQTAGRKGKLSCQESRGYRIGGRGHGRSSRMMPVGLEEVLRHFCRIVKTR